MSLMMRTFVVTMMLASASSFAPSPKTQLATRRPAQAPPRVMPAMKVTYRSRTQNAGAASTLPLALPLTLSLPLR